MSDQRGENVKRPDPRSVACRAARAVFRNRTLSYRVDLIPNEIANAVIDALEGAGFLIVDGPIGAFDAFADAAGRMKQVTVPLEDDDA